MPTYDLKCTMCGYEDERMLPITRDLDDRPLGCTSPDNVKCAGVMEKLYKVPPGLHPKAVPSKGKPDGVKYSERKVNVH